MAAPTQTEVEKIKEFRQANSDHPEVLGYTDLQCLAWLRARDLNLTKANEMFRNHLIWRIESNVDGLTKTEFPAEMLAECQYEIAGNDEAGRPILIVPFGEWDFRNLINKYGSKAVVELIVVIFEAMVQRTRECSKERGTEVTQFTYVCDAANLSMRQLTSVAVMNTLFKAVNIFEANYPETLYVGYVVNASRIFHMLFSIIKPLLSGRTVAKVQIYTSPDKWQPVLLKNLPRSSLPVEYGGKYNTGRRISMGVHPYIDRSLTERLSFSYITVEIGAGKSFELALTVTQPRSKIVWTFETENYDIGFSINFNRDEEVVGYKRCNSNQNEEAGEVVCEKTGDYFVIFDNTYSKIRGKTMHYLVDVVPATAADTE